MAAPAGRKKSGAILCSKCRQLISSKERACPYCGAVAPGLFGASPALQRLFRDHLEPGQLLMGGTILLYGLSLLLDPRCVHTGIDLDFGGPSANALYLLGMTGGEAWRAGHWWTLLTASFLHGSLIHIGMNLMWIRSLAPTAIGAFGPARFVLIYLLSGLGCFLLSNLYSGAPTMGASGAVFGLMGALLAFGRRRGGTFGQAIRRDMLVWAGFMFLMGAAMPGVNNAGHVGGFLAGLLVGGLLPWADRQREARGAQLGALALLLCTVAAVGVNLALMVRAFAPGQCS